MAILASASLEEARRQVWAAKATFYGWMKQPEFQAELNRQRQEMIDGAIERLKGGITCAVDKLLELVRLDRRPHIQLRAAQVLLDHGIQLVKLKEFEERLETLERVITSEGRTG